MRTLLSTLIATLTLASLPLAIVASSAVETTDTEIPVEERESAEATPLVPHRKCHRATQTAETAVDQHDRKPPAMLRGPSPAATPAGHRLSNSLMAPLLV